MTDRATEPVERPDDLDEEVADEPATVTDAADDGVDGDDIESVLAAAPGMGSELELEADPDAETEEGFDEPVANGGSEVGGVEHDYLGDLQRVTAEFANFRKQTEKRNQELVARASQRLAEALLPVLDACDAAALQGVDGVEPIHTQLLSVLGNEGLEVIADAGEPFDPNRHDAVMTEPATDGDESTMVAEVLRTGYAWKGRVFRPAMVKVRG